MFENMAMINEIASYRERDVNYSGVGLAGTIAPVSNAGAGAIGVDERHAIHEDTLGEDLIWHICLIEFRRRYGAESDLMNVEIVILAAWQSKNVSSPLAISIINLASWAGSRGRLSRFSGMVRLCAKIRPVSRSFLRQFKRAHYPWRE
jgi:hypothetical protein